MKNISIIIIISLLAFFSACNPNKDIYQTIDDNKVPYNETFEMTLTDADYATIKKLALVKAENKQDSTLANEIATYLSFSKTRDVSIYMPDFLSASFLALDSSSAVTVSYNYSVNEYDSLVSYTLTDDDYVAMGGTVANDSAFSAAGLPSAFLPAFIESTSSVQGYVFLVKARFKDANDIIGDTVLCYTRSETAWAYISNQYNLTDSDYDNMGAPSSYNNFSSSEPATKYIPTFLSLKYPYAANGTEKLVSYNYYTGSATVKAVDVYKFDGVNWKNSTVKSDQFIHNGTQWLFDPTVYYVMTKPDYQLIVDYVANTPALSIYLDSNHPENTEWYYCSNAYFGNFDIRLNSRKNNDPEGIYAEMTDDEINELSFKRMGEAAVIMANAKFTDAQPVSNGVQVYYIINMKTYQPGNYYYDVKIKCIATGQFEYVEGPTEVK